MNDYVPYFLGFIGFTTVVGMISIVVDMIWPEVPIRQVHYKPQISHDPTPETDYSEANLLLDLEDDIIIDE